MAMTFHACAGRTSYATQIRAATAARARSYASDWSLCPTCGCWHVDRRPLTARMWGAVRRAVTP
jgi:hypothetical protein